MDASPTNRLVWSGLVGLGVIGFEVPEIDSSGLVGLAVIGFEVLGTSSARPTAANLFPSRSISSTLTFLWRFGSLPEAFEGAGRLGGIVGLGEKT